MDEMAYLDATAQAALVRSGDVSARELVKAAIERIERLNPVLNAVVAPMYDQALDMSATIEPDAPFAGVPFLLKDLVAEHAGSPRSDGSRFLAGRYRSATDSELVCRYRNAGLITIGRTNSSEFGLEPATEPACFGSSRNPWDTGRGTGGSSGGSSAAVAAGIVPVAHANDGGGSIRIPASCCGLVGLKPTRGRNSLAPHYGDIAGGIICEHVVTRTVRDSAAVLDATAGPVPGDPYMPPPPARPYAEEVAREPGRLRIGFSVQPLNGGDAHPDCIAAAQSAASVCADLGHEVEESAPSVDGDRLFRSFGRVMTAYLGWCINSWSRKTGLNPDEQHFEEATWRMYQHSLEQSGADYLLAWQDLQQSCREFSSYFTAYDVWLSPTLAKPPVPLGYFDYSFDKRREYVARLGDFTAFTLVANASGQPAVSLPLHWRDDGLPIGVQLTGRYADEATLFRLSAQLEQAQPWADRRPPVNAAQ